MAGQEKKDYKKMYIVIGEYDSITGSGVEQDISIFHLMNKKCITVMTGRTQHIMNGIEQIYITETEKLLEELEYAFINYYIEGIKIGAFFSVEQIKTVADFIREKQKNNKRNIPIVADPVFWPKNSDFFLEVKGRQAYVENLMPLVDIITPNMREGYEICWISQNYCENSESDYIAKVLSLILDLYNCKAIITEADAEASIIKEYLLENGEFELEIRTMQRFSHTHSNAHAFSSALLIAYSEYGNLYLAYRDAAIAVEKLCMVRNCAVSN